ncbi:SusC/RagA family TonB-linked outer membrane protein [Echinicola strongylocentroti]|nr:SusC/RagA family TonB-linked outer membrane protein [Echinicola strongylocentroti]
MIIYRLKIASLVLALFSLSIVAFGQNKKNVAEMDIQSRIVDNNGEPIKNAQITLGEGLLQTFTDSNGEFSLKAPADGKLLVTAPGYEDVVVSLGEGSIGEQLILLKALAYASENDLVRLPTSINTNQRELVGAIGKVSGEVLEKQPSLVFHNVLQGRVAGLTVRNNANGLGNNLASLYVRGLAREGDNSALTIVDGIERPIEYLNPEEVESVQVLKDATSKILYGPRAANGVVMITTKRGRANTRVIKASAQYGVRMNTRMPEYLNSYQYANLYNEARANDGLSPFYSEQDLQGYLNSSGENDLRYPDADYLDYFVRSTSPFRKANIEYSGGTEDTRYALILGYVGSEGVEKIGETATQDRLNIRGNLDVQVTPALRAFIDGNGIIESRSWGKLHQNQVFDDIKTHRPNEYPFVINDPNFQGETTEVGVEKIPPLGGSYLRPQSLYGDMVYGGFQEYQFFYGQTNFGLELDMGAITPGLSGKTVLTFDSYQYHSANQINNPIRYERSYVTGPSGADSIAYVQLNNRTISGNRSESGNNMSRNIGWMSNIDYDRRFDKHGVKANLSHFYYFSDHTNNRQNTANTNSFLRTAYSYDDRLYVEATGAVMGSNRFAEGNRYKFFPAVGASWILSEESFMNTTPWVNFMKVKSSFGVIGYDRGTSYYLYDTRYSDNGNVSFGERNQNGVPRTGFNNYGNPDLKWETSREFNIGVEGLMLNNSLHVEANYFNELRSNIIVDNPTSVYSSLSGSLNKPLNLGEVANQGVEASISWLNNTQDLSYRIGANILYVKNKIKSTDQVDYPEEYLQKTGQSVDAISGMVDNGLFREEAALGNAPFQAFGPYGVGNIAYQDQNGDDIIDERDQRFIGNSFPRTTLGIDLDITYKGFGLYVLGTSELGVDKMLNNSYYRNDGEEKYSAYTLDRFHPVNNPNGQVPALTTYQATNDFRNSTFWMEDASFFRLKNVELSYSISNGAWVVKNVKFYARGTNLFVISKIKDLDPEVPNAGVDNYPIFRTITGGVSVSF